MSATVPVSRGIPQDALIRSGEPVLSETWTDSALLVNWLRGRGRQMVPASVANIAIAGGGSETFRFKCHPAYPITRRIWCLTIRGDEATRDSDVTITAPSGTGTPTTFRVARDRTLLTPIVYGETAARSSTLAEYSLDIDPDDDVIVEAISYVDIPRSTLVVSGSDTGVELESVGARQPIVAGANQGLQGVSDTEGLMALGFERHLFEFSVSDNGVQPATLAFGAGPTSIFQLAIPVLTRCVYQGDTVGPAVVYVLAWCSNGTTSANIAVTAASGDSVTIAVPLLTTTPTWLNGSLDVQCEDLTTATGLQGASWDGLTFTVTRTAGAGTTYVAAVSVFEDL